MGIGSGRKAKGGLRMDMRSYSTWSVLAGEWVGFGGADSRQRMRQADERISARTA